VVRDQPSAVQHAGCHGDADAAHAQHAGQKLLRHVEVVAMRAVVAHQQPASQSRADHVKAHAGRRRTELHHLHVKVAAQHPLQLGTARQLGAQRGGVDAPGPASPLHQGAQR